MTQERAAPRGVEGTGPSLDTHAADRSHAPDWRAARKAWRERLVADRRLLGSAEREAATAAIAARLDGLVATLASEPVRTIGIYWPIKSEFDFRGWAIGWAERTGGRIAVPVVTVPRSPLEYWLWRPGAKMVRGFWDIPVPAEREAVVPDLVLAPLVGFRAEGCWRLGYGGGYFDRTLASLSRRPLAIGVGFDAAEVADYRPEPHDVPMAALVTDRRTIGP